MLDYAESGAHGLVSFWAILRRIERRPQLLHDMRLLLTAIFTSLIVWIVGLAVPVTASYIICAVIAAPALIKLGVPDFAAHMFIFYYAVLSEVSPPTALSPFAAAAITGGGPYRTTLQSWKYTAPAFLVPFMFVLDPSGIGLLLGGLVQESGAGRLGVDRAGHDHRRLRHRRARRRSAGLAVSQDDVLERWMLIVAGLMLVYPAALFDYIGIRAVAIVVVQKLRGVRAQRLRRRERMLEAITRSSQTPFAVLGIRTVGERVTDIDYLPLGIAPLAPLNTLAERACREIERYLDDPATCPNLPFEYAGTAFQCSVWREISAIPAAARSPTTTSRGRSSGAAAGGRRVRREPRSDRDPLPPRPRRERLGGFMGGGGEPALAIKRWLLRHEGVLAS